MVHPKPLIMNGINTDTQRCVGVFSRALLAFSLCFFYFNMSGIEVVNTFMSGW
jgi:hypothetical protein